MADEALTDYERRRLDNIRRNDEMMASLMLHRKASDLAAAVSAKRLKAPNLSPPSKKPKTPLPPSPVFIRRSLRTRGVPPGSEPDVPAPPPPPPPASKRGLINLREAYLGSPSHDRKLLDAVMDLADQVPLAARKKLCFGDGGEWDPRASLVLKPENVKRLLSGRVLSIAFFPFKDRRMIAAGDKFGNVGFWDVDCFEDEDGDGTYVYEPHSAPVSAIVMHPFNVTKIFTSSYDGFVRLMDVENETFNAVYTSDEPIYSASQNPEETNSLYFAEGSGLLNIWDERAGKVASSWLLHDMRINTVDFNSRNTNMMATSCSNGTVGIWDVRRMKNKKPNQLNVIQHRKSVHSAFFSPSGAVLATTSLDDHVRIVTGDEFNDVLSIPHDNRTGRWLSTFRAIWGWDDEYLFVGNMKRAVDILSSSSRTMVSLVSQYMTAIPSRFAAHPFLHGCLACSTAGGQIYLWTS